MKIESKIYWLIILLVFGYLFHLLSPILGPFLFSALLAYLADPIVDKLEKRFSRTVSVTLVFLAIILTLIFIALIIVPLIGNQASKFIGKVPSMVHFIQQTAIPFLADKLNLQALSDGESSRALDTLKANLDKLPALLAQSTAWVSNSANWLIGLVANIFLVPVLTFYLLRDWDGLVAKFQDLLPRKQASTITQIAQESNSMLAAFLRGQFMVMNSLSLIYILGLAVVGVDFAFLVGLIAGWLSFVPYLGLVLGMSTATIMSYFQFHDFVHPLAVVVVFVIAQAIEGSILTPRFVGDRIGLHPVAVIFAVLAGGQLAGFAGILLALPVAAILNVVIVHLQKVYRSSQLYTQGTDEPASSTILTNLTTPSPSASPSSSDAEP